jgi:hypothetical protein
MISWPMVNSAGDSDGLQSKAPARFSHLVILFLVLHLFHVHLARVPTTTTATRSRRVILRAFFHLHVARITTAATTCHGRVVRMVLGADFHFRVTRIATTATATRHGRVGRVILRAVFHLHVAGIAATTTLVLRRMLFRIFHRSRIVTAARHRATRVSGFLLIALRNGLRKGKV